MTGLPHIRAEDTAQLMSWPALVDALQEGHRGPEPQITDQFLTSGDRTVLSRAAWIDGLGVGVKTVTVFPENPGQGRPTVQGAMLVFDPVTGTPRATIDNGLITYWKTAADSVLGARFLARSGATRLLIIGAGTVARSLIEAYPAVLPGLEHIAVWNRTRANASALASETGVRVADNLPDAVGAADIVATCTLSQTPVLEGRWLSRGTHVDLIGAFTATMREADDEALRRARIFVDSRATTLHHIGELKDPLERGVIQDEDVLADYRDLAAGAGGRLGTDDITLCKNGGGAHLDLMTADVILRAVGL
ncbi:MAG: Gfo/Idh/MocA family oxidoreductase [Pseudomonadota bacterium]